MTKARPVIVLARPANGLCIVVPLSTSCPRDLKPWHHEMNFTRWPQHLRKQCWAKCDVILTVADWRLDRYFQRDQYGKRKYMPFSAIPDDFEAIRRGVFQAMEALS